MSAVATVEQVAYHLRFLKRPALAIFNQSLFAKIKRAIMGVVVFVSKDLKSIRQEIFKNPCVVISPSRSHWDDFGFRLTTTVEIHIPNAPSLTFTGPEKLYIEGYADTAEFIERLPTHPYAVTDGLIDGFRFNSTLGLREHYERLLAAVGLPLFKEILLAIYDISAIHAFEASRADELLLNKDDAFHRSLLRTSEAYFAFVGLQRMLRNVDVRAADIERTSITFLEGVSSTGSTVTLDFTRSLLGRNLINAFIGPNGAGKTRLLRDLALTLLGKGPDHIAEEYRDYAQSVIASNSVPVTIFTHDPERWTEEENAGAQVRSLSANGASWIHLTRELFDLIRGGQPDSGYSWNALMRIVKDYLPIRDLHFPRKNGTYFSWRSIDRSMNITATLHSQELDDRRPPVFVDDDMKEYHLSSGQRAILVFLTRLFAEVAPRRVFLIDEPEIHLHPQFISLLMLTLHDALSANNSWCVVATHSPYVVRELDKTAVLVVKPDADERAKFFRPTLQTRGADIAEISNYVFEQSDEDKLLFRRQVDELLEATEQSELRALLPALESELGVDARFYLHESIARRRDA